MLMRLPNPSSLDNLWRTCVDIFICSLKYGRNVLEVERRLHHSNLWDHPVKPHLLIQPFHALSPSSVESSSVLPFLVFTSAVGLGYAHLDHQLLSMSETIEHRLLRSRKAKVGYLPEFPFHPRPSQTLPSVWTNAPGLLSLSVLRVRVATFNFFFNVSRFISLIVVVPYSVAMFR